MDERERLEEYLAWRRAEGKDRRGRIYRRLRVAGMVAALALIGVGLGVALVGTLRPAPRVAQSPAPTARSSPRPARVAESPAASMSSASAETGTSAPTPSATSQVLVIVEPPARTVVVEPPPAPTVTVTPPQRPSATPATGAPPPANSHATTAAAPDAVTPPAPVPEPRMEKLKRWVKTQPAGELPAPSPERDRPQSR